MFILVNWLNLAQDQKLSIRQNYWGYTKDFKDTQRILGVHKAKQGDESTD